MDEFGKKYQRVAPVGFETELAQEKQAGELIESEEMPPLLLEEKANLELEYKNTVQQIFTEKQKQEVLKKDPDAYKAKMKLLKDKKNFLRLQILTLEGGSKKAPEYGKLYKEAFARFQELKKETPEIVAKHLRHITTMDAMQLRWDLKDTVPDPVLESLRGLAIPAAMELRWELKNKAPVAVAQSLKGVDTPESMELRRQLEEGASKSVSKQIAEAVLDSIENLSSPEAPKLRSEMREILEE